MDNRWWDTATGCDIERVHEAATAWKDHDPAGRNAAEVIRDQVPRRYGLDIDNLGADEPAVAAAKAKAERDREQAQEERLAGFTARYSSRRAVSVRRVSRAARRSFSTGEASTT